MFKYKQANDLEQKYNKRIASLERQVAKMREQLIAHANGVGLDEIDWSREEV